MEVFELQPVTRITIIVVITKHCFPIILLIIKVLMII